MRAFDYKELDSEGLETLEAIAEADKFNSWMFETISPFCAGKVLEIGSGIGNISDFFIEKNFDITLSDIRDNYCSYLKKQFPNHKNNVLKLDLVHPDFDTEYSSFLQSFDTVFALNVVEHIEDDLLAVANCKKLLKPSGKLILLVPAFQFLYNKFDKELYHYRRYNKSRLNKLFLKNNFVIQKSFYFNTAGIFGWYLSGKLLRKKTIPKNQMKLYNTLMPIIKLADKLSFKVAGLSVITVGINN